jgi:hypothetical protein
MLNRIAACIIAVTIAGPALAQSVQPVTSIGINQVVAPLDMETARQLVTYVRLNGLQCRVPDMIRRCLLERCFEVRCDLQWTYTLRATPTGGISIQAE